MAENTRTLVRGINFLAAALSAAVAISLPAVYFALAHENLVASLETEAETAARMVTEVVNANPEMWRYEEHRLSELLARRPGGGHAEKRRILDERGGIVFESREEVAPPLVTRWEDLMDSGRPVGRIEISRSMRLVIAKTALVGLGSLLLGLAVFAVLRFLPLAALRQALDSLFREKEQAQVTLHSIADAVITTGLDERIELINAAAEKLTGWSKAEARGRPLEEVFRIIDGKTRERCGSPVGAVLRTGMETAVANGAVLIARDGSERVVPITSAPIRDRGETIIGSVLVFRDETEKRRAEEELLKAQKLESIGMLAGGIAHDFNNILTSVLGNLSLAERYGGTEGRAAGKIEEARNACLRAKDLTNQFLAFSKGWAPVKRAGPVADILREAAHFALAGSKSRCEFAIADDTAPVEVDAGQVSQVIQNLVINADHATAGGGIIRVGAENAAVSASDGIPLRPGRYVRISVQDHGCGIPREHLPKIFDPYFTTKDRGSGLGLATSYFIVKNHGGHIAVQSAVGAGTTFLVYLPTTDKAPDASGASDALPVTGTGKILVMDDEKGVRDVAAEMLACFGYEVELASDGAEALRAYLAAKAQGAPFDAVVMDLTIPGGMGGKEAVRRILEADPGARAIVSSGYSNDPVMADPARYGFRGMVAKPYRMEDLCRVVREVISGGGA